MVYNPSAVKIYLETDDDIWNGYVLSSSTLALNYFN